MAFSSKGTLKSYANTSSYSLSRYDSLFFLYLEETAHLVEKGEAKIFQFLNIGTEHLR